MERLATLRTDRTHLFMGAGLERDGTPGAEEGDVVLLFGDGERAEVLLVPAGDQLILRVDAHRTAAGTAVPAKTWVLEPEADGRLRVVRRSTEPPEADTPQDGPTRRSGAHDAPLRGASAP